MSLINDALKRAKQAQTENPAPPPELPFRAAEPSPQRNPGLPLLPLAALIVVVVLGGVFIFIAMQKRNAAPRVVHATQADPTSISTLSPTATTPPTTTPAVPAASIAPITPSAATATVAAPAQLPGATPATASTPSSPADVPAATIPEPPKPIVPKLQGIFYTPSRPSAVMNGKTVYVGSRVGDARDFLVLAISRESVTVGNGSQTNVLVMEE